MADPANTISSFTYRKKWYSTMLQQVLRNALVAEKVCEVDNSDLYTIENPYGSQPTATVSTITGTYSTSNWTTTNDTLTVNAEIKMPEHIYDFEKVLLKYDMYENRMSEHMYAVAKAIDTYVINNLCEDGTGTYSTPSGGFTTAANVITIMANLGSQLAGYTDAYKGLFLIIENTDLVGFTAAQATNGYSMADSVLKNGFMSQFMGFDIYVVRSGTFTNDTQAGVTWTNSGHRVAGVKGVATYASPRGISYTEKEVSGRTGKEILTLAYCGFKLWSTKTALVIDITIV